jgi:glutamine amidotransferase
MCRWITVLSTDEFCLLDIVLAPSNSLIQMSVDASWHPGYTEVNNHVMNGDGFGIGWYHSPVARRPIYGMIPSSAVQQSDKDSPHKQYRCAAVFRDILPVCTSLYKKVPLFL